MAREYTLDKVRNFGIMAHIGMVKLPFQHPLLYRKIS